MRAEQLAGAGAQAEAVQLGLQLRDGVFAGCIELEGQCQEGCPLGVGLGDGDLAAVGQPIDGVAVAEPGPAVGAALLGLAVDAAPYVLAGLHRLVLVLGGDDGLREEGGGAVAADHGLADGDELRAGQVHQFAGLPVVLWLRAQRLRLQTIT